MVHVDLDDVVLADMVVRAVGVGAVIDLRVDDVSVALSFSSVANADAWLRLALDRLKVAAALPVAAVRGGASSAPGTTTPSPSVLNTGSATVAPDQSTGTHGNCVQIAAGPDGAPAPVSPPVRAPIEPGLEVI